MGDLAGNTDFHLVVLEVTTRIRSILKRAQRNSAWDHRRNRFRDAREVNAAYEGGFVGVVSDPEADEQFDDQQPEPDGAVAGSSLAGSGKGKLITPFVHVEKLFPGSWPGPAQQRGDCVSHSTKNAALLTMACEIAAGDPDDVTGEIEGVPKWEDEDVKRRAILNGVVSSEAVYWYRDHNGDGWSCSHAATVISTESGVWIRKPYPDLGFDLTEYSGRLAGKWGRPNPPNKITQIGRKHLIRVSTRVSGPEQCRDFLANGYGISTCGGESWSSRRGDHGYAGRTRSGWAHALAFIGWDERPEIVRKFGEPLVLILNSWGKWNSGPRRILGTSIDIPHGSWWSKWSDASRRSMFAFSSFAGFPPQSLPDLGVDFL